MLDRDIPRPVSRLGCTCGLILLLILGMPGISPAATEPDAPRGYYRHPAVHGDTVVFAAEGDLWSVDIEGGVARRLTSHASEESHPAVSPDGTMLAMSAAYEGPTEVYVMPLAGGLPERLTWEAERSIVAGWTPDGAVLYATEHDATLPAPHLVTLDPTTRERRVVPLAQASDGAYDDQGTLFFARPAFHRNNTQRYRGGTARDLWRFAPGDDEAANLTRGFAGGDHSPMPWAGRVYHVTDRDGTMNLWSMDPDGGDLRQHTHHDGWDVRDPSLSAERIVYQLGADLWRLDLATGETAVIDITLTSDFDQLREKWVHEPLDYLTAFDIDPEGERVVLTARGRVFVLPVRSGRRVQVARAPGVRLRDAVFMPGGEQILLLSDQSGELELQLAAADGTSPPRPITDDGTILRFRGVPSPDGRSVAYTDKNEDLHILDVETGRSRRVSERREGVRDPAWSPDSSHLAYVERAANSFQTINIFRLADGQRIAVTGDRTNSTSPVWSADGQWLTFLSDRHLRSVVGSPWGPRQPEAFFDRQIGLFQVALTRGARPSFRPYDELHRPPTDAEDKSDAAADSPPPTVTIDEPGLAHRLHALPVPPGNYRRLSTDGKAYFWLARDTGLDAEEHLQGIAIDPLAEGPVTLARDVEDYRLAARGGVIVVRREDGFGTLEAKVPVRGAGAGSGDREGGGGGRRGNDDERSLDLEGWRFPIQVREDLRQLFIDAWRLERDYFYDPGMHGVDWNAVRDKYLPLVDRVTSRAELSDLIGQAMAELSALHVSVRGGDLRTGEDDIALATLGARLERDPDAGGYRVETIYRADPDYPAWRSPLADPYAAIEEGDVISAINGTPLIDVVHPGVLLRDQAGRQVRLRVRDQENSTARDVVVMPIDDERDLRYHHWEHSRRLAVESASGGDVGYVHLRAMGRNDLAAWYRAFYPVFDRRGLIIDVRHNRGGNIDSLIHEKLLRRAWFYWQGRVGDPYWNMQYAFRGHMVVLIDHHTASDGEAFAEGFRRLGLGKLIGTRTWGGEIWLSSNNRLSDRGLARAPQNGVYGPERAWLIEGHGVEPDIEVENLPHETFAGRDRQLEAALAHLDALIAEDPRDVPAPPPFPDKSKAAWERASPDR